LDVSDLALCLDYGDRHLRDALSGLCGIGCAQ
jgi:hypothetical protein